MNKIFSKTLKKGTLTSVILAVILAAAIVICALFGFNGAATMKDSKTLTVSMNKFAYTHSKDTLVDDCEKLFGKTDAKYVIEGEMSGDECQVIFVFDKKANVESLQTKVDTYLADKKANDAAWEGVTVATSVATEEVQAALAKHYVLRAAIAGVALAVLAFGYVAARYQKVSLGLVVGVSTLVSMLMTASVIVLTRVPVTTNVSAVIAVAGLLTAISVMLTVNKTRALQQESEEKSNEELIVASIPVKETLFLAGALAIGVILIGAVGKTEAIWFGVASLIGILVSTAISFFFAPAMYWSVKGIADAKAVKSSYVGAKKTSAKQKKVKKAAVSAEEAPATEPVEETVEESVEEPIEEAPVQTEETVEEE